MKFKTIESNGIKTISFGTEQIARCLRVLAVLKNLGSIHSTHMAANNQ